MSANFLPTVRPTDRRSTYELCWSSVALSRERVKGVLIDVHGLWTVIWPTDCKFVRRPRLNQLIWAEIFGSFWSHRRLCKTDCGSGYGPSMPLLVAPAYFFSVKLVFFLFWLRGVTFEVKLKSKFIYYAYVISSFVPLFFLIVDY